MTDEQWLARLDAHMERGNEIMARSDVTMARSDVNMARNRVAFEDLREYMTMATEALRGLTREIQANRVDTSDLIEESRAQRRALLAIIDRMDGLDGGTPGPKPA